MKAWPSRVARAALLAWLLSVAVAACSSGAPSAGSTAAPSGVKIAVDHPTALADTPLDVRITGLTADQRVTVQASAATTNKRQWLGFAMFHADAGGAIDLATAMPGGGGYRQPEAMGLFRSMLSTGGTDALSAPAPNLRVTLSVRDGSRTLASQTVTRVYTAAGVTVRSLTLAKDGFIGHYYAPVVSSTPRPAVLLFGGGEGGLGGYLDTAAALLASHGHPALAIGYFGLPGLPGQLTNVRLEYFTGALTWLRGQPGVDRDRVFAYGDSRGSEAALLLGARRPDLVHGVVALVPSSVVHCAYPNCSGPSWTMDGVPLPYTREFGGPTPTDEPAAVIPVERIAGPVFLVCGESDTEWPSCPYARAIDARLAGRAGTAQHLLLAYPGAGHKVGLLVPYQPDDGGAVDGKGQEDAWPRLLALLDA